MGREDTIIAAPHPLCFDRCKAGCTQTVSSQRFEVTGVANPSAVLALPHPQRLCETEV